MTVESCRNIGKRLSNWGRWGASDQRGTLNHVTPERVAKAAREVTAGKLFDLSLPLDAHGPQRDDTGNGRRNPMHVITMSPSDEALPGGLVTSDDMLIMHTQAATQWDGLPHVGYDGFYYNGVPTSSVTTMGGAARLGIDHYLPGVTGRGVLLDIAHLRGVPWLDPSFSIVATELERAESAQGVKVGPGDIVLLRTGWVGKGLVEGWANARYADNPGLERDCGEWMHEREVAAIAADNWMVEVSPSSDPENCAPLHCIFLRDMGLPLGELFDLEALSKDCISDGRWSCLLVAPPLKITNGIGSPVTPIALK
jgi:kynurenine formamidase